MSRRASVNLTTPPRQYSTGGKPRLGPISKMGNRHLRKLLVVGAHAALYSMKKARPKHRWLTGHVRFYQ
jgi:transposase